jgi:hypothetical protein
MLSRMASAIAISVLALASVGNCSSAQAEEGERSIPILQRMLVLEDQAYGIDFDSALPSHKRTLVCTNYSDVASPSIVSYSIFPHRVQPADESKAIPARTLDAYRWTIGGGSVFAAADWDILPPPGGTLVLRYPIQGLVVGPDGKGFFDHNKLAVDPRTGHKKTIYVGLSPMGALRMGITGWKEGDELMRNGFKIGRSSPKIFHYDIRALDDTKFELYMSADRKLQLWLFDGKTWWLQKDYTVEFDGPFLVCNGGKAAVAEVDGSWCMIGPLADNKPRVVPIVEKKEDEALLLIEDVSASVCYFEQAGQVYDAKGKTVGTVQARTDMPAKIKTMSDLVRSMRSKVSVR